MNKVFQAWCEWDLGQEGIVFEDSGLAVQFLDEAIKDSNLDFEGFDDCYEEGLCGIDTLELIKR